MSKLIMHAIYCCFGVSRRAATLGFALILLTLPVGVCLAQPSVPKVEVGGIDGDPAKNVMAHLSLARAACDAPAWRLNNLLRRVDSEVLRALRPFGYYKPAVKKQLKRGKSCWSANIQVDPGTRLRWTGVDIQIFGEAADDPAFVALQESIGLKVGDPVAHADYDSAKAQISLLAAKHGYRDGRFEKHQLRVDLQAGKADAILHYRSGPRYRFGAVTFEQSAFDSDFVERFSPVQRGDYYSIAELNRLQRDLSDSGLFQRVELKPSHGANEAKEIDVDVVLEPRQRHAYSAGFGFSTDEGPRVRLGYENRRLNRRGHTGKVDARVSSVRSNLNFDYQMPLAEPLRKKLSFQAGYQLEDIDDTESELYKIGTKYIHRRENGVVQTLFLDLLQESFVVGEDQGDSFLLMPGVSWDMRRSDHPVNPTRGWRLGLELKGASKALLSDVDFVRAHARAKGILPLGNGRLIGRGELGLGLIGDFDDLPASQRFFAGGDNSVRGYGYRDLGPRDSENRVLGASQVVTASVEYEHPIEGPWSVAVFADSGDAFDDFDMRPHHAIGFGVRWRSPIGPVRIDLAHPLDSDASPVRLHLSLGPDL